MNDELNQIQEWLTRSGYGYGEVVDEPDVEGVEWFLEAYFPSESEPTVIGRFVEDESVVARRNLMVNEEHQKTLKTLPEDVFREFYLHLKRDLLLTDTLFTVQGDTESQLITQVSIARSMWVENLERGLLIDNLQAVYNSMLLAKARIQTVGKNERSAG